jgi:Gpi18-like mannosyltransferase
MNRFWLRLTGLIVLWRLLLTIIVVGVISYFPYTPTFPYASSLLVEYGSRSLTTFAQFDGVHYLTIIRQGYEGTGLIQAFFPLYPLLVRLFSLNGLLNHVTVGLIISTTSLMGAYLVWWRLLSLEKFSMPDRRYVLWLNASFSVAFFYFSLYTESLFLLLSLASFYLMRRKLWWGAGLLALLAALTRVTGVFLVLPLAYEYWTKHKKIKLNSLAVLMPVIGLGIYMAYLDLVFNDPLLFVNVQNAFGAARETNSLILLPQVFYRYVKMLVTVPITSLLYYQVVHELLISLLGLAGLILAFLKLRTAYALYALALYLVPTFTGTFSSMPRYVLVIFPLFMVAGLSLNWFWRWGLLGLFIVLQIINLILFTQGLWVA